MSCFVMAVKCHRHQVNDTHTVHGFSCADFHSCKRINYVTPIICELLYYCCVFVVLLFRKWCVMPVLSLSRLTATECSKMVASACD